MIGRYEVFRQQFIFFHHLKGQGKVNLALSDGLDKVILLQEGHLQMYLRILCREAVDGIGDECRESVGGAYVQASRRDALYVLDALTP